MPSYNGFTIRVSDGIKTADYAPPRLYDLTANIVPADGETPEAAAAHAIAVLTKVGRAYLGQSAAVVDIQETPAPQETKQAPKPRAPKAETPPPAPDPALTSPATPASEPGTATEAGTQPTGGATSGVADLLPDPPAKEITNEEIVHAVMAKNEALKDATPIRALVETYNPSPGLRVFKATEIDQKDRADFLAKLADLKV